MVINVFDISYLCPDSAWIINFRLLMVLVMVLHLYLILAVE